MAPLKTLIPSPDPIGGGSPVRKSLEALTDTQAAPSELIWQLLAISGELRKPMLLN